MVLAISNLCKGVGGISNKVNSTSLWESSLANQSVHLFHSPSVWLRDTCHSFANKLLISWTMATYLWWGFHVLETSSITILAFDAQHSFHIPLFQARSRPFLKAVSSAWRLVVIPMNLEKPTFEALVAVRMSTLILTLPRLLIVPSINIQHTIRRWWRHPLYELCGSISRVGSSISMVDVFNRVLDVHPYFYTCTKLISKDIVVSHSPNPLQCG